ncbi:hypothetical protein [Cupriavidus necator]|uniref:hypothetical protein n=1 Tax=Cupriavidus necator TaxID=106590 RepID=UPI000B0F2E3E|nr:hypothetical protein [Cupriavidus necator]
MTVFNELFDANRNMFREDELLIATGNARHDTFTGGVRFTAESVMDLVAARTRFASAVRLAMNGNSSTGMLRELLTPHLARASGVQGLPVRIHYQAAAASCEAMLGPDWKVVPSDEALTALRLALSPDSVSTVYE